MQPSNKWGQFTRPIALTKTREIRLGLTITRDLEQIDSQETPINIDRWGGGFACPLLKPGFGCILNLWFTRTT